jgi:hypothetical protein
MKITPPYPIPLAAIGLAAALTALCSGTSNAAVTLNGNDTFVASGAPTGDLTVTGDLSVVMGIDIGTAAANPALSAVQFSYFGGSENAVKLDLTDPLGTFLWRDKVVAAARNKMKLDGGNILTLYKSDGTAVGVLLDPNTGQIQLQGTGGGIYAGGTPVFTIGSSGNLVFGNRPFSVTNTTAASSSSSGALTVAGGLGVALDSYINGIRVGRGGGNVTTNTVYGSRSLYWNTTGYYNTAGGYASLYTNTTGYYNTTAGAYSLFSNMTGYNNSAYGVYSLYSNTKGYGNTATGSSALYRNTTGYYNTAHGSSSLYSNTTGYSNTVAGGDALYFNTTGVSNVAIGYGAGKYQSNGTSTLIDPDNSVYIGANARGFSNLDQNSIVIGSGAIGEGANTTVIGNSNTVKTHLYGTVNANTLNAGAITINNSPVVTTCHGTSSSLSNGAILAFGDYANASQSGAVAIGTCAQALGWDSLAIGTDSFCADTAYGSVALTGGTTTREYSLAAGYGQTNEVLSLAFGAGVADGACSIALGGYDWSYGNSMGNHSVGENSVTLGGVSNQALGFSSFASGFWTKAVAPYSVVLGSLNRGLGSDPTTWVDTDPLLELGNGYAPRSSDEPAADHRSNAITTLKNGQTTLTNKAWLENVTDPLADPASPTDSDGEALVVEGHTRLKGKVIIEQAQGDISMGIYGP